MIFTYPQFPSYNPYFDNIGSYIIQLLIWIISIPLIAIANFIASIGQSLSNAGSQSTDSVIGFITQTWNNSVSSFSSLGIFAPIIASLIWGISILILIFFLFKAVQLGIRETEDD